MKDEKIKSFFERKKEMDPMRAVRAEKVSIEKEPPRGITAMSLSAGAEIPQGKEKEKAPKKSKLLARWLDGGLKFSIFMIFLGLPVYFTGQSFQGIAFERQMYFLLWILLGLVFWVSKGLIDESIKIRRTPLDIPILFFWTTCLIATLLSVDRWHSFWGWFGDPSRGLLGITAIVAFYYLFISNFSQRLFHWTLGAFVFSGFLVSLYTAVRINLFNLNIVPENWLANLPFSPMGSFHSLGIFLGMMILVLLTIIFKIKASESKSKFIQMIGAPLLGVLLILDIILLWSIYGFVPVAGLAVGLILLLIFILSKLVKTEQSLSWLPMLVFIALIVMIMLNNPLKFGRAELPNELGWPSYKASWEIAKNSLKDSAIAGSGPATYGYDFSKYKPKEFNAGANFELRYFQGKGIILEAISTLGILGTFALLILIFSYIWLGFYYLFSGQNKDKIYSLGIFAASLSILIDALFFHIDGSAMLLGIAVGILALAIIFKENESEEKMLDISLKASAQYAVSLAFVFVAVVTAVVFIFVFLEKSYAADIHAKKSFKENQVSAEGSIKQLENSARLFSKEGNYQTLLGYQYMLLVNKEVSKKDGNPNLVKEYLDKGVAYSKNGADLMKNDVSAVMSLGMIYENKGVLSGDYSKAEETYKRALELDQNNPNAYLKLGQIKFAQGNLLAKDEKTKQDSQNVFSEAKDFFQKSVEAKNDFASGYLNLALAQEKMKDFDGAIDNAQKAVILETNVNNYFILAQLHQARGTKEDIALAERYFKQILGVNNKEINTLLNLGILYENSGRKGEAVAEYRKVLELLPESQTEARNKIQEMINGSSAVETVEPTVEPAVEN